MSDESEKMSASNPESHLDPFDTPKQTRQKIARSFCRPGVVHDNPALRLAQRFIFPYTGAALEIQRSDENGGNISVASFDELEKLFADSLLHPGDLKASVVDCVNNFFEPIRRHFGPNHNKIVAAAFPTKKGSKNLKSSG
ncbi:hypothetical protein AB6A40_009657 [Gnathostoma spinigerum]|uniref:tyrosine--tRNA ligase n=1 Tax=Gnathostoma spinigerum TaxID=75299 RepID=A0ABD6F0B7_9BILA